MKTGRGSWQSQDWGLAVARIRSIKPEFWTDGDMLRLSDSCRLFFIGLWNFCDDEGKHRLDLNQLVAEFGGTWHRGKVKLFVSCLVNSGQLRINSDSTWLQVTGWSHQKIDKPKQPEIKSEELQWLSKDESAKALEHSRTIDARIGSDRRDRIGSDLTRKTEPSAKRSATPARPDVQVGQILVGVYCDAWKLRYKSNPPIRPQDSKSLKAIGQANGLERTKELIAAYLTMNESWFIQKRHDLATFANNLTAVAQFVETGRTITRSDLRTIDSVSNLQNTLNEIRELGV